MEEIVFGSRGVARSPWDLSEPELAAACRFIAEGRVRHAAGMLRTEAIQLFIVWIETLNMPVRTGDDRETRAALLSGLRKRTIQVLVRLRQVSERSTPVC